MPIMLYQLPSGKVVHLTIEEYLELTDEDIQYMLSIDYGEHISDPFRGSAMKNKKREKYYDFDFTDEDIENDSSDNPFDDIIDLSDNLDT